MVGQLATSKYGTDDDEDYETATTVREAGNFLFYVALGLLVAEIPRFAYLYKLFVFTFCEGKVRDLSSDRQGLVDAMHLLLLNQILSTLLIVIIVLALGGDFNDVIIGFIMNYVI